VRSQRNVALIAETTAIAFVIAIVPAIAQPAFEIPSKDVLIDEPIAIRITALQPGRPTRFPFVRHVS